MPHDVVILIQAREGSARYPGKVLAPFLGSPMLTYQVQRFQRAGWRPQVLVPQGDLGLVALQRGGIPVQQIRGDPADVLGRYARYARLMLTSGTVLVRACGDCPLLCPALLGALLTQWNATPGLAYLGLGPGWPDGLADYDVFTREALLEWDAEATLPSDREHVVPFCWRQPDRYPQTLCLAPTWLTEQTWPKLSVDTPADLVYVEQVAQAVTTAYGAAYTWMDVLHVLATTAALQRVPEAMNAAYTAQVAQEQGGVVQTWEAMRYRG